jgi:hypothetical protein
MLELNKKELDMIITLIAKADIKGSDCFVVSELVQKLMKLRDSNEKPNI